ncbi:MAG: bifunctional precorrin-2 dehydrogenase/sirohydrochlorin ferrochelatase [Nitrososphaerota archaeon]|nr:bifunctional precorrin-2 dehydrogenase/sirohydrochlorin ferrochelatase [Nitrososphaerota archaeon]MDG6931669.1 bifunctional precorrin-2 dehydrogenase/sirohydrochlorin ferrochelatase [Nitrososphaerota archaeon]MDG6936256.1 bifunctional precorrin-2 dehydrogenase/sirohydrochlorin ferrochelatase [Nitrososphaerota archaeon]MDG6944150.1 bifunctional precorrin-2 dehydrogenase/sirohydrochlorin ferrochelatase [Nitrososphaerota archaeon]
MASLIPLMVDVENKKILIVGGGHIAYRKAALFLKNGADVTVIAKEFHPKFRLAPAHLIQNDILTMKNIDSLVSQSLLVIAATGNREINDYVEKVCISGGKLCNVVDKQGTHVMFPAFFRRGDVIVSVSTSGNVPYFAAFLRDTARKELSPYLNGYSTIKGIRKKIMNVNARTRMAILKEVAHNDRFWKMIGDKNKKGAIDIANQVAERHIDK